MASKVLTVMLMAFVVGCISAAALNRTERSVGNERCYRLTTNNYKKLVLNRFRKIQTDSPNERWNTQYDFLVKPLSCHDDSVLPNSRCTPDVFVWEIISPDYADAKNMPETSRLYIYAPCGSEEGSRKNVEVKAMGNGGKVDYEGIFTRENSRAGSNAFRYKRFQVQNTACYLELNRSGKLKTFTTGSKPEVEFQGHPVENLLFDFRLQEVDCKVVE